MTKGHADNPPDEAQRLRARAAIADAVATSWATIPHFGASREVTATQLLLRLTSTRDAGNPRATMTDLFVQATASALPTDVVGLSVATDFGVVNVPLAGLQSAPLAAISELRSVAVHRARRGRLRPGDLEPAQVVISNLGSHGVRWFTGIIPLGSRILLSVGAVAQSGVDPAHHTVWVTANADHRLLDGSDVAAFLERFAAACEGEA